MKVVFADTGYWVAVLNPKDDWNAKATAVSRALGKARLVTTEMVHAELLAALSKLPVRPMVVRGVDAIRSNPNIEVVPPDVDPVYRGVPFLPANDGQGMELDRLRVVFADEGTRLDRCAGARPSLRAGGLRCVTAGPKLTMRQIVATASRQFEPVSPR